MTTKGEFLHKGTPSTTKVDTDGSGANPAAQPETPEEQSWWQKASPWVHGALGIASFVPGVSVISGGLDAAIYAGEGDLVEAGIAAASMIPGGKVVTTAGKVVKGAVGLAKEAGLAGRVVKGAHEAEEVVKAARLAKEAKIAKEAKEAQELKKAEEEAAAAAKGKKDTTVKKKKPGPCDHLRQGSGKGPHRGGAHSKTSKPANDGKDSHHAPADDVSPLKRNDGPAIQMDPSDHKMTSSNGSSREAAQYRQMIDELLKQGKWREAMAIEIGDIRRIAKELNDPRKYNEASLEMLEYFKCLEKNGLLPGV
jgi:hypothetical protein